MCTHREWNERKRKHPESSSETKSKLATIYNWDNNAWNVNARKQTMESDCDTLRFWFPAWKTQISLFIDTFYWLNHEKS